MFQIISKNGIFRAYILMNIRAFQIDIMRSALKSMAKPKRGRSTVAIDDHVGGRIRERRIMLGLTQQQLAEMIGVTYQQAHKYERGINRVSAGRLFEIARALSAQISYFYEGIGEERLGRGHVEDFGRSAQRVGGLARRGEAREACGAEGGAGLAAAIAHDLAPVRQCT